MGGVYLQTEIVHANEYALKNETKEKSSFFKNLLIQIVLFVMLGNASIFENNSLLLIVVCLSTIYCLFTSAENLFSFVVGISIFDYAFNINGMNATVIPTGILLIKLLIRNKFVLFKDSGCAICMVTILFCELVGDFSYHSVGEVFLTIVNVALFLYLITNLELLKVDVYKILIFFASVCLVAIYCMLLMYGNIGEFFNLLFTSSSLYRFGIGDANVMGGAMSLPLYALLLLSVSLSYVLTNKNFGAKKGILIIFLNAVCIFFAFLTISRSLYLGLGAILLAIILGNKKYNKSMLFKLFIILVIALVIAFIFYGDVIIKSISLLFNRISSEANEGSRVDIWGNCLSYLVKHPVALLIGCGSCSYPTLDEGLRAGTHNLFMDILMSWGVLGLASFFVLMKYALNKIKISCNRIESMSYIPLYAICAFGLTALRSNSLKTWSFLLVAMLIIQSLSIKKEARRDDT